uniref:Uncharacterized protein n=1 Tax=Oryza rufipogon TaxID=4529 RepID=A0A0E0QQN6_ORYRU
MERRGESQRACEEHEAVVRELACRHELTTLLRALRGQGQGQVEATTTFILGEPLLIAIRPVFLVNGDGGDAARALAWLDAKPARSVVYICFGSLTRFPHEQVAELGMGLADSGVNFVWVVGDKNASASLLPG